MKNSLDRLALQVFNRPLLINGGKLEVILGAVGNRILNGVEVSVPAEAISAPERDHGDAVRLASGGYIMGGGVGVFPVMGTVVRRGSWLNSASGLCSYDAISDGVSAMMQDGRVKGVMLEIDSPGGEASGCFDLVRELCAIAQENNKPIWAMANDMACSGGYAIACAADQVWITELGEAGSIGVVATHVDVSGADKKAGLKWEYIKAGEFKTDGNPHEPLTAEVRGRLREDIDTIYDKFANLVSESRGMSVDEVKKTEARIFMGQKAVDAGLVDSVGTFDSAVSAFADFLNGTVQTKMKSANPAANRSNIMKTKPTAAAVQPNAEDEVEDDNVPAVPTVDAAATAKAAAADKATALEAANTRATEIMKIDAQARKLGVTFDAIKALSSGASLDAIRTQVLDSAADKDAAAETVHIVPTASAREASNLAEAKAGWDRSINKAKQRHA